MTIGRIGGPMLKENLVRQGVDISIETDLTYFDVNNYRIGINTATPAVDLDVNGTARVSSALRFGDGNNSNWVAFQAPTTVTSNVTWTLPATDGSSGNALLTQGDGTLYWGAGGGGSTSTTVGTTPPALPTSGDLWWNSEQGQLKVYYDDGDTAQWVDATLSTGAQGPAGYAGSIGGLGYTGSVGAGYTGSAGDIGFTGSSGGSSVTVDSIAPVTPSVGDMWWNSEEGQLKVYYDDGTSTQWVDAAAGQKGDIGYTGSQGPAGGYTGSAGITGFAGSVGFTGSIGYTGSASTVEGFTGSIGFTGSASTIVGYTGSAGTTPSNLSTGYTSSAYSAGTKSSGTFTPDPLNGNLQTATNGGAHTLAPPSTGTGNSVSMVIQYTNNGSAGAITTSGYTKVEGSFTTTNGDDFMCFITVIGSFSHLNITALQ